MPEDWRVITDSSPTGKLQMHAATNVEHWAIVNDEQHIVDEVERCTHDTRWICAVSGRGSRQKYIEVTFSGCQLNNDLTN